MGKGKGKDKGKGKKAARSGEGVDAAATALGTPLPPEAADPQGAVVARAAEVRGELDPLDATQLCFGAPVLAQGHTIIPVAAVRGLGRLGYLRARPEGFIAVGPGAVRYEAIAAQRSPRRPLLVALALGLLGGLGVASAAGGGRAVRRRGAAGRRSPRRWPGR